MILNIIMLEQLSVVYVCAHVCKLTCVCRIVGARAHTRFPRNTLLHDNAF